MRKIFLVILILIFCFVAVAEAVNENEGSLTPRTKDGKKWRIGYCESRIFVNYPATLNALIRGLTESGWLTGTDALPFIKGQEDTRAMWEFLASHDLGPISSLWGMPIIRSIIWTPACVTKTLPKPLSA